MKLSPGLRLLVRAGLMSLLGTAPGCAFVPQFGPPPFVGPPAPFLMTAEQAPIIRANDPVPVPAVTDFRGDRQLAYPGAYELYEPPRARVRRSTSVVRATPPVVPAPADSVPAAPEDPITIVTRGSSADTRVTVEQELAEATRLVHQSDSGTLTDSKREKVRNLYDLIDHAERALQRGDVSSAAGLARKARLLAAELGAP